MLITREKKIMCGKEFMEVDIIPYTKTQQEARSKKRAKKKNISPPKQKNLNDKNAKRYFGQLINSNFTPNDLLMYFSFAKKHHPESLEEAEKIFRNFIARINNLRKKKGLGNAKYIWIVEYGTTKDGKLNHIHFHMIIDGELHRDEIEDLWRFRKTKGQKKGTKIGHCSSLRLEPDENGLIGLSLYLTKIESRKRKWTPSQNLKKPVQMPPNDSKYSKRQVERIARGLVDQEYWRRKYPGWRITNPDYGVRIVYNEFTGYHIYLRLRKDSYDSG